MFKRFILTSAMAIAFALSMNSVAQAQVVDDSNTEELNPFAPNVEETLRAFDEVYEQETGISPFLGASIQRSSCYRESCAVYAYVSLSEQRMYLYENGDQIGVYKTSSGADGHETPSFDTHPDGRIYNAYTSTKYPQGDYNGLGNMPYAVFISGGFAIHGTTEGNFSRLGQRASHGCIRLHPDNAHIFNQLVRQYGVSNTWITVE